MFFFLHCLASQLCFYKTFFLVKLYFLSDFKWCIQHSISLLFVFHFEDTDIVRLVGGETNYGIVQLRDGNGWLTLCAWPKFGNYDAQVICGELGYTKGSTLPLAAFGPFDGNYTEPFRGKYLLRYEGISYFFENCVSILVDVSFCISSTW